MGKSVSRAGGGEGLEYKGAKGAFWDDGRFYFLNMAVVTQLCVFVQTERPVPWKAGVLVYAKYTSINRTKSQFTTP